MNLARYVAQFLEVNCVSRVFGLPGGENVQFIEALRDTGLDFVLFHHEAAAGFAAGVTGQLTGRPGVCLSTVGPGAANLVAAAAAATLERSPMLAITAEIDTQRRPRVRHMKLDLARLFGGVVKDSVDLRPESVAEDLAAAWNLALTPPMGTVHVAIAPNVASAPVIETPVMMAQSPAVEVDDLALERAADYLKQADHKMILAGVGVEAAGAQAELVQLAEELGIPVAVTPKAKGHFPESHPLYVGCYSAYGDGPLQNALGEVNVLLGVGLDSVDFVSSSWDLETPVVNLNLAQADDEAFSPVIAVDGNLKTSLTYLTSHRELSNADPDKILEQSASIRKAIAQDIDSGDAPLIDGTCRVGDVISGLRRALPGDGVVTVDVGVFKLVFLQQWKTDYPKSLFVANGLSAMGYAIPGAIAIRLEQPGCPVAAVVGDGALLMYAGELATVSRLGQPLVILVVVDEALSLIRLKQIRSNVPISGTEFEQIDYSDLADAFGLDYRLIDGEVEAEVIFCEALALDLPVLVEARVDREEYNHYR